MAFKVFDPILIRIRSKYFRAVLPIRNAKKLQMIRPPFLQYLNILTHILATFLGKYLVYVNVRYTSWKIANGCSNTVSFSSVDSAEKRLRRTHAYQFFQLRQNLWNTIFYVGEKYETSVIFCYTIFTVSCTQKTHRERTLLAR